MFSHWSENCAGAEEERAAAARHIEWEKYDNWDWITRSLPGWCAVWLCMLFCPHLSKLFLSLPCGPFRYNTHTYEHTHSEFTNLFRQESFSTGNKLGAEAFSAFLFTRVYGIEKNSLNVFAEIMPTKWTSRYCAGELQSQGIAFVIICNNYHSRNWALQNNENSI